MNFSSHVKYDGTRYAGWQKQENGLAVQNVIETALSNFYQTPIQIDASGRTDAGVHASAQVISFALPKMTVPLYKMANILNKYLPPDISLYRIQEVSPTFHPRYSSRVRHYRYKILSGNKNFESLKRILPYDVHFTYLNLDITHMQKYLAPLIGSHDFTAFCAKHDPSPVKIREIFKIFVFQTGPYIYIDIYGNAFLRNMVRAIIGNMVECVEKRLPFDTLGKRLTEKNYIEASNRAPAKGLTLESIYFVPLFGNRSYYRNQFDESNLT